MTLATAHKHITRRGIGYRGSNHFRGSERKTATRQMRDRVERIMKEGLACDCCNAEIKALFTEWIENRENTLKTKEIADKLIPLMEACQCDICKQLLELHHSLVKKSQWIFGGDGWGYDIGFGGLDHVLASGEDVNVVVVNTEVYSYYGCEHLSNKSNEVSNTGRQSSNEQNFQWTFYPASAVAELSAKPTAYLGISMATATRQKRESLRRKVVGLGGGSAHDFMKHYCMRSKPPLTTCDFHSIVSFPDQNQTQEPHSEERV